MRIKDEIPLYFELVPPFPAQLWTHLIIYLQCVLLAWTAEMLCVSVHGEVDVFVKALNLNRVPVVVIQQASQHEWGWPTARLELSIICTEIASRRLKSHQPGGESKDLIQRHWSTAPEWRSRLHKSNRWCHTSDLQTLLFECTGVRAALNENTLL